MCIILFSYQPDSTSPLILGANRDELFSRPTEAAAFWKDYPALLAGKDLTAGGTWLGINKRGRFAAITNVREPDISIENPLSRGNLTRDFLIGTQAPFEYLQGVMRHQDLYAGFNLLVGEFLDDHHSLFYLSNRGDGIQELAAGTYGLSNHLLDSPWPKVIDGKNELRTRLLDAGSDHYKIREILENTDLADDARLPSTGIDYETEKALSALFICLPRYGTRTSTVLTMNNNKIVFSEQNYIESLDGKPNLDGPLSEFTIN